MKGNVAAQFLSIVVLGQVFCSGCGSDARSGADDLGVDTGEFEVDAVSVVFPNAKSELASGWVKDDQTTSMTPLPKASFAHAAELIKRAVDRYPDGFLRKHVDRIYAWETLSVGGLSAGGTYEVPSTIHIAYTPEASRFWTEHCFHAEVSSLLYHKFPSRVSKVGFVYRIDDGSDVATNFSLEYEEDFIKRGFLYPYAASSPEEDFNSVCAALLSGDRFAWKYATEFKRFGEKFEKAKRFLKEVDGRFTEEYLWSIAESWSDVPR